MSATMKEARRVAIVGRPNVGKSTLFNRLVGRRRAITLDTPGVTRDPIEETVHWRDKDLILVDTGGLGGEAEIALADKVHEHTLRAMRDADVLVVLLDARAGVSPLDADTVDLVNRSGLPAVYVANKSDGPTEEASLVEFCELGIEAPLPVSSEHGLGMRDLKIEVLACLKKREARDSLPGAPTSDAESAVGDITEPGGGANTEEAEAARPCRVALVGRPNVGKSSLLNLIAGEALSLVDDAPGTTRDAVDTTIMREGRRYVFVDTAGMRRPSRVKRGVERISVGRSIGVIERADVVVLLVEATEGVTDQDARIANRAWSEGRALVILVNKIDLLGGRAALERVRRETRRVYPTLSNARLGFVSVLKERGIDDFFDAVDGAHRAHNRDIPTVTINRIVAEAADRRQPPVLGRGRLRLLYATQTAVRPPTISVFVNRKGVPTDYERFLERCVREQITLEGSPLRLRFVRRDSHGPGRE